MLNVIEAIKGMSNEERKKMGERGKEAALRVFNYKSLSEKFLNIM